MIISSRSKIKGSFTLRDFFLIATAICFLLTICYIGVSNVVAVAQCEHFHSVLYNPFVAINQIADVIRKKMYSVNGPSSSKKCCHNAQFMTFDDMIYIPVDPAMRTRLSVIIKSFITIRTTSSSSGNQSEYSVSVLNSNSCVKSQFSFHQISIFLAQSMFLMNVNHKDL